MAQQLEKKFIYEYLLKTYGDRNYQTRQRVGPLPPGVKGGEYEVASRWVDAIIFEPSLITLIEAKLEPSPKAIGQLEAYEDLFKVTLRYRDYWGLPLKKVLLTTRPDANLRATGEKHGIEYVVFRPDWIEFWEKNRFRYPGYKPLTKALG